MGEHVEHLALIGKVGLANNLECFSEWLKVYWVEGVDVGVCQGANIFFLDFELFVVENTLALFYFMSLSSQPCSCFILVSLPYLNIYLYEMWQ